MDASYKIQRGIHVHLGLLVISGVQEKGNAEIRRRENKKVAVVKKHGRAGIIVRVDRLTVLTVKLKAEALVQLPFRVFPQVDLGTLALRQCGLQAVLPPVLLRSEADAYIRNGVCGTVYNGDLHGILLHTAGGNAQTKQQR